MIRILGCITQQHDLHLVALAVCICALACFTTVTLIAHGQAAKRMQRSWLIAAAIVFGSSVWSLHFVSMLAFMPELVIAYDLAITVGSVVIAWIGTLTALMVWGWPASRLAGGVMAGFVLGLTVAAMHYCGIAAMRPPGTLIFDHAQVAVSIGVAVVCGVLAMTRAARLAAFGRRAEVSCWLALCVCGLHFTGMSALTIDLNEPLGRQDTILSSQWLAVIVGVVTLALLLGSLAAALLEEHILQERHASDW